MPTATTTPAQSATTTGSTTTRTGTTRVARLRTLAARVDAATPPDRDRLMDALRVLSMLAVAVGHWLMAVVWVDGAGTLQSESLLVAAPSSQALTYLLQVVPLFVVVAGWSSARSLAHHTGSQTAWIHGRVRRLLLPTTLYVAVVAAATQVVGAATDQATGVLVGRTLGVHLWFTATICLTWLGTPWLHRAWRALGHRALVVALAGAVTVDAAVRLFDQPWLGWANFLLVFGFCTLLGFAWHDGAITRRVAARMAMAGTVALVAAVASPWYPASLVGVPGATQSNNSPLSICIALIAVVHVGLVVLAAPAVRRVLHRPVVWFAVVTASRVAVSVYLWHLLALVVVTGAALHLAPGALAAAPLTRAWWLTRPLWLAVLVMATAPLVWAVARFEQRPAPSPAPGRWRTIAGTAMAAHGCAHVALAGPAAPLGLAAVAAGAVIGRWVPRTAGRRSRRPAS